MANGQTRGVWRIVLQNFINSLKPRQFQGNNMGKDYLGNVYFELPPNPSSGKRKPARWYDPPKGLDFDDPIPAEWEAWLRMRRKDPPTAEEIEKNIAVAKMKKINAANLEQKRLAEGGSLPATPEKGIGSFPKYSEYHGGHPDDHPKYKSGL